MPRFARVRVPGIPLHIIQRGNNREPCFFTPADRRVYLDQLKVLAERFACAVHAYVLMDNHVHLLVTPPDEAAVSLLMKHLGQRYVQYVNRRYERVGTLWAGRFRSHPVQRAHYLLACYRYIELNPVRAGMVRHPGDYAWSSYRVNAGLRRSSLLTPHDEYLAIGAAQYQRLFRHAFNPRELAQIRSAATGCFALGDERFVAEIATHAGRRVERAMPGRQPLDRNNAGLSPIPGNAGLSRFLDVK
jgi:putative transposase